MFDSDRLEKIIDTIVEKITLANRIGQLEKMLEQWGLEELIENEQLSSDDFYDTYKNGKIVVLGGSSVKEKVLLGIIKELGLDKNRFEFCLDYDSIVRYQFSKLQYNPNYRLVIVGSMPHSTAGKGDSSSAISEMEKGNGYPKVVRLGSNDLKVTKTGFKKVLQEQIAAKYI